MAGGQTERAGAQSGRWPGCIPQQVDGGKVPYHESVKAPSISIQAYAFFFRSAHVTWGAHVGDTVPKKLLPCPPLPCCHRRLHSLDVCRTIHGPHGYVHTSGPQPCIFFATPASRRTAPQTATHNESPHDHPGHAPFLWTHPGPSDMHSPLSMCCGHPTHIPHALRVPQPQP